METHISFLLHQVGKEPQVQDQYRKRAQLEVLERKPLQSLAGPCVISALQRLLLEAKKTAEVKSLKFNDTTDIAGTYDRIERYWKRQRAISHRQYHTALKIMHAGMQKFKAVSAAMENAIAGKKPSAQARSKR